MEMATIRFFHQNKKLDRRIQEKEAGRILRGTKKKRKKKKKKKKKKKT